MKGLLRKAIEIREERKSFETRDTEESGIPPGERDEILKEINRIVEKQRIQLKPENLALKPLKKDVTIPIIVNIAAIIVLAAGIYLLFSFFNQKESAYVSSTGNLVTAESKVIETLKKESEKKINEKNREILQIQSKLGEIKHERDTLKASMEEKIRERERQLKEQMDRLLESEREKLKGQGLSESDIQKRISAIQAQMKSENEKALLEFKKQTEEELKKREEEISKEISRYQSQLEKAKEEADRLKTFYKERENELKKQYESEKAALLAREKGISAQLSSLKEIQKKEDFAFDQIFSIYKNAIVDIESGNYESASGRLDSLEELINKPDIASLPAIKKRKPVEDLTVKALHSLIRERKRAEELEKYKAQIDRAAAIVKRAENYYRRKRFSQAKAEYEKAITAVSAISGGYKRLRSMQSKELQDIISRNEREKENLNNRIETLNNRIEELQRSIVQLQSEIADLKTRLEEEKRRFAKIAESIEDLETTYKSSMEVTRKGTSAKEKLLSLLETKIIVKQIVTSGSIRRRYPDLYNKLEDYFDVLAEENRREGQAEVLDHISSLLSYLYVMKSTGGTPFSRSIVSNPPKADFISGDSEETTKYIEMLDKLKKLLQ